MKINFSWVKSFLQSVSVFSSGLVGVLGRGEETWNSDVDMDGCVDEFEQDATLTV